MQLSDKVAIVTGASGGIGSAIARALANAGAKVCVHYRTNAVSALKLIEELRGYGTEAFVYQADATHAQDVEDMVSRVVEEWGKVDILVNNAGITHDTLLLRLSEGAWDNVVDTNLKGAYVCTKAALKPMWRQRSGRIICISSIAGIMGNAGQSNYSAAKAGLIGFTKSVAREVAPRGITANVIAPGFIQTPMTDKLPADIKAKVLEQIPLGRFGQPEDVAPWVMMLASDAGAYVTGQVFVIDGGIAI